MFHRPINVYNMFTLNNRVTLVRFKLILKWYENLVSKIIMDNLVLPITILILNFLC